MKNKVLDRFHRVTIVMLAIAFVTVIAIGCKGYGKPPTKDEASTRSTEVEQPEDGDADTDE